MRKKPLNIAVFLGLMCVLGFADDERAKNLYGKNLYENPRGIACNKCHGAKGEGGIIARYKHKGVEKTLLAPRINHIDIATFYRALEKQRGVMPSYYLTDEEISAIYFYLYQP